MLFKRLYQTTQKECETFNIFVAFSRLHVPLTNNETFDVYNFSYASYFFLRIASLRNLHLPQDGPKARSEILERDCLSGVITYTKNEPEAET